MSFLSPESQNSHTPVVNYLSHASVVTESDLNSHLFHVDSLHNFSFQESVFCLTDSISSKSCICSGKLDGSLSLPPGLGT